MSNITDSMARYIDNIPDGALHTCSDLCITAPCLIVRGKREIERLRAERDEAVALLRIAKDKVAYMASGMTHAQWVTLDAQTTLARIEAFLAKLGAKP